MFHLQDVEDWEGTPVVTCDLPLLCLNLPIKDNLDDFSLNADLVRLLGRLSLRDHQYGRRERRDLKRYTGNGATIQELDTRLLPRPRKLAF